MLAVVHCPLALQLADSIGRRQALSLASGAAAASVLSPGAATAATAAASPLKLPSFGVGAWAWGDSLFWKYEKKEDAALRDVFDYVVESGVTLFDTAEVYDPQTDGWQPLAKMSTARWMLGLAAVGGKIYAIGGWDDDDSALESVEAYDPQLGAWAPVASMSVQRYCHASVVLDGKIYVMGGNRGAYLDTVEVYDPQADSWQRVASMPQGLCDHAAAAVGGKIYVIGGETDDEDESSVNSVYVYDPQADAWAQLASMRTARLYHASAAVGGKLYVFGGYDTSGRLSTAEVYDLSLIHISEPTRPY